MNRQQIEEQCAALAAASAAAAQCREEQQRNEQQPERRLSQTITATTTSRTDCSMHHHHHHDHPQSNASTGTLPTDHFRCRLKCLRERSNNCTSTDDCICPCCTGGGGGGGGGGGDVRMMNINLNEMFLSRLEEIDCLDQESNGTALTQQLRLVTFQEWVDMLLHVNNIIFSDMSTSTTLTAKEETCNKIKACLQSVRGEQDQSLDENRRLRKDMCAIIKLIQNAYHKNNWNTDDICLETMSVNQLLGIPNNNEQCRPESESEKVKKCLNSLATEVAGKHDEVCQLKTQLAALDEKVQTAGQKLLLKDQCIAQLNQQLQEMHDNLSSNPMNIYNNEDCNALNILQKIYQQENEMCKVLDAELSEFLQMDRNCKTQAMASYRQRLACLFNKMETERANMMSKLESVRSQLQLLECQMDQDDPLISTDQVSDDDPDSQLIEGLKRRLCALQQCNKDLHTKSKRLETQYLELQSDLNSERNLKQINCKVLKEIADLISKLDGKEFSYENIYCEKNPFCEAISEMVEKLEMKWKNPQENQQLKACVSSNEIHTTATTTTTTTHQQK